MKSRLLCVAMLVYVASALFDDLFTYFYVVRSNVYAEANPRSAILYLPPALCVALDVALFSVTILAMKLVARRGCLVDWRWLALALAIVRAMPAAHNALLALLGIETPIPRIYDLFAQK